MAKKTRAELTTQANIIKNETTTGANTAVRVGQMDVDQIDSFLNIDDDAAMYDQSGDVATNAGNIAALQAVALTKTPHETWETQPTDAGHTVDVGREVYIPCVSQDAADVTTLEPKLFILGKSNEIDPQRVDCVLAAAQDLSTMALYGLNTTAAESLGDTDIVLFGLLNGVKTDQWSVGDILYADITAGELTNQVPSNNIFPIARVEKVGAIDGIIFVFSVRSNNIEVLAKATGVQRTWFTGEETTITDGTFYEALTEDKGTVPTVSQEAICPDDTQTALAQDLITPPMAVNVTFETGVYNAILDFAVNNTAGFCKLTVEYYMADGDGVVIDSGSGLPNGTYPFAPIVVLESPLIDAASGVSVFGILTGSVESEVPIPVGNRIRVRVLCEKVGTAGSTKTFTVYYGSDHLSFADTPKRAELGDLSDVDTVGEATGDIIRLGSDMIWRNHAGNIDSASQMPSLADFAAYQNLQQGDVIMWDAGGFWQNIENPMFLISQHINSFTGNPSEPVITNAEGKIAGDLLDTTPLEFVGDFTPEAGTEYPPTPSVGQTWIVVGVGNGYTFTGGDLNAETAYQSSWMQWTGAEWLLLNNTPSSAITADIGLVETNNYPSNSIRNYEAMTQAEYDGLGVIDPNTLYLIV